MGAYAWVVTRGDGGGTHTRVYSGDRMDVDKRMRDVARATQCQYGTVSSDFTVCMFFGNSDVILTYDPRRAAFNTISHPGSHRCLTF